MMEGSILEGNEMMFGLVAVLLLALLVLRWQGNKNRRN